MVGQDVEAVGPDLNQEADKLRISLSQILNLAIDERNSVNFSFLKK